MRASVITCTFNRDGVLRKTLASLCSQEVPDVELLVIDDGSTDKTPSVVVEFPRVRYIRLNTLSKWKNPAHAMNVGIQQSVAPIIIFHSSGVVAESDTIEQLTSLVEANPDVAVFGRVYSPDIDHVNEKNKRAVFALGAMRREHFETLRGFDEDFTDYGAEDNDMAQRIREGLKLRVIHDDRIVGRHQKHARHHDQGSKPDGPRLMSLLWASKRRAWAAGRINHVRNLKREWGA